MLRFYCNHHRALILLLHVFLGLQRVLGPNSGLAFFFSLFPFLVASFISCFFLVVLFLPFLVCHFLFISLLLHCPSFLHSDNGAQNFFRCSLRSCEEKRWHNCNPRLFVINFSVPWSICLYSMSAPPSNLLQIFDVSLFFCLCPYWPYLSPELRRSEANQG